MMAVGDDYMRDHVNHLRDQEIGIMADRHNSERLILTFVIPAFQFLRGIILCLQIMEFFADCLY